MTRRWPVTYMVPATLCGGWGPVKVECDGDGVLLATDDPETGTRSVAVSTDQLAQLVAALADANVRQSE